MSHFELKCFLQRMNLQQMNLDLKRCSDIIILKDCAKTKHKDIINLLSCIYINQDRLCVCPAEYFYGRWYDYMMSRGVDSLYLHRLMLLQLERQLMYVFLLLAPVWFRDLRWKCIICFVQLFFLTVTLKLGKWTSHEHEPYVFYTSSTPWWWSVPLPLGVTSVTRSSTVTCSRPFSLITSGRKQQRTSGVQF